MPWKGAALSHLGRLGRLAGVSWGVQEGTAENLHEVKGLGCPESLGTLGEGGCGDAEQRAWREKSCLWSPHQGTKQAHGLPRPGGLSRQRSYLSGDNSAPAALADTPFESASVDCTLPFQRENKVPRRGTGGSRQCNHYRYQKGKQPTAPS